jgi:hypothetical protein
MNSKLNLKQDLTNSEFILTLFTSLSLKKRKIKSINKMLAILISASLSLPTTEYHLCPYIEKCGLAQNYLCDDFCDTPACNYGEMIRVFNAKCTYAGCRESFDWEKANMNIDVAVK